MRARRRVCEWDAGYLYRNGPFAPPLARRPNPNSRVRYPCQQITDPVDILCEWSGRRALSNRHRTLRSPADLHVTYVSVLSSLRGL